MVGNGLGLLVSFEGGRAGAGMGAGAAAAAGASVEVLYREVSFPAAAVGMGSRAGSFWMRW